MSAQEIIIGTEIKRAFGDFEKIDKKQAKDLVIKILDYLDISNEK